MSTTITTKQKATEAVGFLGCSAAFKIIKGVFSFLISRIPDNDYPNLIIATKPGNIRDGAPHEGDYVMGIDKDGITFEGHYEDGDPNHRGSYNIIWSNEN